MVNDVLIKLKRLDENDFIWLVYIFIILANLYSDNIAKKDLINSSNVNDNKVNNINLITLVIAFLIYLFFVFRNYKDLEEYKNKLNCKTLKLAEIRLVGSILFLVGGAIAIYVTYKKGIDDEIALI